MKSKQEDSSFSTHHVVKSVINERLCIFHVVKASSSLMLNLAVTGASFTALTIHASLKIGRLSWVLR